MASNDDQGILSYLLSAAGGATRGALSQAGQWLTGRDDSGPPPITPGQKQLTPEQAQWIMKQPGMSPQMLQAAAPIAAQAPGAKPPMPPVSPPMPQRPVLSPQGPGALNVPPVASEEEKARIQGQMVADAPEPPAPNPAAVTFSQAPQATPTGYANKPAVYDGMINAGVGMLRGRNAQESLANGFAGFNAGYDGKVAYDKAEATPKITPLGNGAFSLVAYPNGTQKILSNKEVQEYESQKQKEALEAVYGKQDHAAGIAEKTAIGKENRKASTAASAELQTLKQQLDVNNTALETLPRRDGLTQGGGTGIGGAIAGVLPGKRAAQISVDNMKLAAVKTAAWLKSSANLKGALSNIEGARLDKPLPANNASPAVWKAYLLEQNQLIQEVMANQRAIEARGQGAAAPAAPVASPEVPVAAPAAPQGGKFTNVPGVSSQASSKYY